MDINSIIKHHPGLTHSEDIQGICRPLKRLGLSFFAHTKLGKDGALAAIASNPHFLEDYYRGGYYQNDVHCQGSGQSKYIFRDPTEGFGKTKELYERGMVYGVWHMLTIIERNQGERKYYHFAAPYSAAHVKSFFMQKVDALEKFITYFNKSLLINDRLNRMFSLTCSVDSETSGYFTHSTAESSTIDLTSFLKDIDHENQCTAMNMPKIALCRREKQCAFLLLQGKTSPEIAEMLKLSKRTVEVYFERLRMRFGSRNKIQLVRHLMEFNFLEDL